MKRSTERILATHVGSLARPDALVPVLKAKDRGQPYDNGAYARLVREAVADVVRRQTEAGVDVITVNDTHPSVAWLKFAALAEGARLATRQLWGRA